MHPIRARDLTSTKGFLRRNESFTQCLEKPLEKKIRTGRAMSTAGSGNRMRPDVEEERGKTFQRAKVSVLSVANQGGRPENVGPHRHTAGPKAIKKGAALVGNLCRGKKYPGEIHGK